MLCLASVGRYGVGDPKIAKQIVSTIQMGRARFVHVRAAKKGRFRTTLDEVD